jgi:hypothetical protein
MNRTGICYGQYTLEIVMKHWADLPTVARWLSCSCLTLCIAAGGCQALSNSSLVPGMEESRRERQIVRQAEYDPFPSPGDVGIRPKE